MSDHDENKLRADSAWARALADESAHEAAHEPAHLLGHAAANAVNAVDAVNAVNAVNDRSRRCWRGVAELLAGRDACSQDDTEFPEGSTMPWEPDMSRRDLLKLLGAGMALAGVSGCLESTGDKALPYVAQPPEVTPGTPLFYATSMVRDGFASGLLVQAREGRPIKIEGNPEHPASMGKSGVFEQASILDLYDPHRARAVRHGGAPSSWLTFSMKIAPATAKNGLWFLLHPQSSPLMAALMAAVRGRHPGARFAFHAPLERRAVYAGARQVFGRALEAQYDFSRADVVLALDADFMNGMPMSLRWARDVAAKRRLSSPQGAMSRLYVMEAMPSPTGTIADHRLRTRAGDVPRLAARILGALMSMGQEPLDLPQGLQRAWQDMNRGLAGAEDHAGWIAAVARDLVRARGASIVIAGDRQPPETHAIAHLINHVLGNFGRTVTLTEPALFQPEGDSLADLAAAMQSGAVQTLVILEDNPVYTAPGDMDFARLLARVPQTVHMSLHHNETSRACQWLLPAAHFLESWGDARAYDGTISFIQPLVRPLYDGKTAAEILAAFAGIPDANTHALVRDHWRARLANTPDFEWQWQVHVQRGFIPGSGLPAIAAAVQWDSASALMTRAQAAPLHQDLELNLTPSPKVHDGRFANNGWLQELPHPLTKLTWDNAAIMSPHTAVRLGINTEDVIELRVHGRGVVRSLRAPALVLPGHADDAVTLELGYGRQGEEALASGVGANAYGLRTSDALHVIDGLVIAKTGARHALAITQEHWDLHGRELALTSTLAAYRQNPQFTRPHKKPLPSLLPPTLSPVEEQQGDQWAMTIDTMICTGCSACVVACQAENNIPIVGKTGVRKSREMHWLRIDRYFTGSVHDPEVIHQPMMCQHCEKAPCEYVCPVNATVHSPDGLNEMVYNRCIGTRFCSNNCPYKVRRFNWFEYNEGEGPTALQHNPSVTVRERGVMEKCTYCVQRIRSAQIQARIEGRRLLPNEVVTACQQACPTGAIKFGSLDQRDSDVVVWRQEPRVYAVLHELGTMPRTQYLARITNPNPEME